MIYITIFVILGTLLHQSLAATCWRNTVCSGPLQAAFPGLWDANNFSPSSRNASPVRILNEDGEFLANYPGPAELKGDGALLIFDFGKEVGGIVTVTYTATASGTLGLAFSESKNWTGIYSDDSNGALDPKAQVDGALFYNIKPTTEANYTMPDAKMRGGFRYLTIFARGDIQITLHNITCELSFAPTWSNLRAYGGYFDSSDPLLNKIWYSGAYTLQTNSVPSNSGRVFPLGTGWANDGQLNLGTSDPSIYVDGSKRDRTVWAGDLAIAIPSILVSTGDWDGIRNTLQVLLNGQESLQLPKSNTYTNTQKATSGMLPFAGPGLNIYNSDTYHMITMIGIYDYYLFTKDDSWMSANWGKFIKALSFITSKIDKTGLLYVTGIEDWGRVGQGAHNTEANMLMYRTLTASSSLAKWKGDSSLSSKLSSLAAVLKDALNSRCWDLPAGAFGDSESDNNIHPQDGNSMALVFGVAKESSIQGISNALTLNWIPIGSVAPELPNNLVGYGQSFEVKGHFSARQAIRALDLIRRAWGWYLNNPDGTASTCIEGYLSDGSFGYRASYGYGGDYSYTSHAHGWSTGPVEALTASVVGLQLTSPGGSTWLFEPQFGDLTHAEGGFTTPMGQFSAKWVLVDGGYDVRWKAPAGTTLTLALPSLTGRERFVKSDGSGKLPGLWNAQSKTFVSNGQGPSGSVKIRY